MSQGIFQSINPNTTSGTQLAIILNDFKDAVVSGFSGTTRPANLQSLGYWIDTTNQATGILVYKMYDGVNDIPVFTINTATGTIVFPGTEGEFQIIKNSNDALGPILKLQKKRVSGGGKTLEGDTLGDIDFLGNNENSVTYVQARIRVTAIEDVSTAQHGASMGIFVTAKEAGALTKVATITGERRIGIGTDEPSSSIHMTGSDNTIGVFAEVVQAGAASAIHSFRKKRVANNGQVLVNDGIGTISWKSTDQTGAEIEVARMRVLASETHTDANQGSAFILETKKNGENVFSTALEVRNGEVTIAGQAQVDTKTSADMVAPGAALFSVNGDIYGAFEADIFINARDNASNLIFQKLKIFGIYDKESGEWRTGSESNSMGSPTRAVKEVFQVNENITVEYENMITGFQDGKIYINLRRNLRRP